MLRTALCLLTFLVVADAAERHAVTSRTKAAATGPRTFIATAYSTKGNTVKGVQTQPGIVAADPRILPLGSTIRVTNAGAYSGLYVVTDVGIAIIGRRIDIFISDLAVARAFGRKRVRVELIKAGDNVKFQPETISKIPKSALAPAQKEDAAAIPANRVPADKSAVQEGRAIHAQEKTPEKTREKIEEAKRQ